jgi:hypothetical protein
MPAISTAPFPAINLIRVTQDLIYIRTSYAIEPQDGSPFHCGAGAAASGAQPTPLGTRCAGPISGAVIGPVRQPAWEPDRGTCSGPVRSERGTGWRPGASPPGVTLPRPPTLAGSLATLTMVIAIIVIPVPAGLHGKELGMWSRLWEPQIEAQREALRKLPARNKAPGPARSSLTPFTAHDHVRDEGIGGVVALRLPWLGMIL